MSETRTTGRKDQTVAATMLVDEFVTALVNSRIYQLDHPRLQGSLQRVLELARNLANLASIDRIRIACTEGMVFFAGKPLIGASISAARLIAVLDKWKAGGIELSRHATRDELAVFFACILENKRREQDNYGAVNARATERRCIHVLLLPAIGSGRNGGPGGRGGGGGGGEGGLLGRGGGGGVAGMGGGGDRGGSGGPGGGGWDENSGGGLGGGPGHALSDGGGGSGDGGGGSGGGGGGGGFGGFSCLPGSSSADRDALRIGVQTYQQIMDMLQGVTVAVCRGGKIDFAPVLTQAEKILEHLETRGSALLGLARQDHYDAFTFGHSIRVAIFAMNFARALHASRDMQIRIGAAALLHDVGKSLIPFEILHSTARLSAEERREMSRHAELGAQCLLDHHDSDPLAIAAAFGHHLSPDGTGYPNTVHEQPITWITSIVKICDIYEALTASRPYKSAMPPIRAYRIMLAMGDKLDRGLLKRFIEINGIYPIGQMVELAEGAIAVVKEHTDDPLHPIVMIVRDDDGEGDEDDNELFDLREVACPNVRIILREVLSLQEFRNEDAEEPEASPT